MRATLTDLVAFVTVARERSFTRAAKKLGVSQSAVSHTIRGLEARLGMRLLTRTTRSVSTTEAGDRLVQSVGPHFEEIEAGVAAVTALGDKPAGAIRITTSLHPAETILWPALVKFLPRYPEVKVEISVDTALTDIAAHRFDAGVRLGEQVAQGMIAVRIGPDLRMAAVASPSYLAKRAAPRTPRDLTEHNCINMRVPTYGGLYAWEFEKNRRELKVRVEGQLTFNDIRQAVEAAQAGFGIAYVFEDQVRSCLKAGRLKRVLEDWCPPFPGYHLYYPSRRYASPAFPLLVDALRYRG